MPLDAIAALLSDRVGFDAKIIGDRKLARAVEQRRAACRLADSTAYFNLLQTSLSEFNQLVEQLVVPETWFFRDRKPFDFLMEFVRSEWLPQPNVPKLRVLSVPCSTGEEPYSIAIALLEAGLSVNQFSIDAIDISNLAIAKAQRAIYGKNSFRGEDWVVRNRYFQSITESQTDKYELSSLVRQTVNFRHSNLLTLKAETGLKYNVIFCRNLLIYLEDTACQQILRVLHSLLCRQGLLFVGAAETSKVPSDHFTYLRQSFTFAYRKLDAVPPNKAVCLERVKSKPFVFEASQPPTKATLKSTTTIRRDPDVPVAPLPSGAATSTGRNASDADLQRARALADAGHLVAAIDSCKAYLECHFTNADAYTLLGTLYQATINYQQAERYFQKALYLQPHHYEALMHLALLKEACGDAVGAKRLQQRIQKIQHTS